MEKETLNNHLEHYANNIDYIENIGYWKLSDLIIETIIQNHIDKLYNGNIFTILDAGCGNGRWIEKIIQKNPEKKLKFIAYDLYKKILDKAEEKLKGYTNISFIHGDLENIKDIEHNTIDLCISIYGPISYVENSDNVIEGIGKVLKNNGEALIMGISIFNPINSDRYIENMNIDKLQSIVENENPVGYNTDTSLKSFSIEDFIKLGNNNRIKCIGGYGITIYIKPLKEDWAPQSGQRSIISKKLEDNQDFFGKIYELEMKNNSKMALINKGNNILALFKK